MHTQCLFFSVWQTFKYTVSTSLIEIDCYVWYIGVCCLAVSYINTLDICQVSFCSFVYIVCGRRLHVHKSVGRLHLVLGRPPPTSHTYTHKHIQQTQNIQKSHTHTHTHKDVPTHTRHTHTVSTLLVCEIAFCNFNG